MALMAHNIMVPPRRETISVIAFILNIDHRHNAGRARSWVSHLFSRRESMVID